MGNGPNTSCYSNPQNSSYQLPWPGVQVYGQGCPCPRAQDQWCHAITEILCISGTGVKQGKLQNHWTNGILHTWLFFQLNVCIYKLVTPMMLEKSMLLSFCTGHSTGSYSISSLHATNRPRHPCSNRKNSPNHTDKLQWRNTALGFSDSVSIT